jgi:hypothetical protein
MGDGGFESIYNSIKDPELNHLIKIEPQGSLVATSSITIHMELIHYLEDQRPSPKTPYYLSTPMAKPKGFFYFLCSPSNLPTNNPRGLYYFIKRYAPGLPKTLLMCYPPQHDNHSTLHHKTPCYCPRVPPGLIQCAS